MNKIYKIIWSKTKQRYVVVSELAHSCAKRTGRTLGKSAAALMAVLALTAGVGVVPVWAAENDTWTGSTDNNGNYSAYLDEENNVSNPSTNVNNFIIGDGNKLTGLSNHPTSNNSIFGKHNIIDQSSDNVIKGKENNLKYLDQSKVFGNDNSFIGNMSNDDDSVLVIGDNNSNNSNNNAYLTNSFIIGSDNVWKGTTQNSIILGNDNSLNSGDNYTIIGNNMMAGGTSNTTSSVMIGNETKGAHSNVIIGYQAAAYNDEKDTYANNSVVIGTMAKATASSTLVIGRSSAVNASYVAALGNRLSVGDSIESVAVGEWATIHDEADNAIAIGGSGGGYVEGRTEIKDGAKAAIAIGGSATIGENAVQAIAIGGVTSPMTTAPTDITQIKDGASYSAAFGSGANVGVNSEQSLALGYLATIGDEVNFSTTLGSYSSVNALGGTALGYNSSVNSENSVALGRDSKVDAGDVLTQTEVDEWLDKHIKANWNISEGDIYGVVSVGGSYSNDSGSHSFTRRITGVSKGRVSADSTDAINGSQLRDYAVKAGTYSIQNNGSLTLTLEDKYGIGEDYQVTIQGLNAGSGQTGNVSIDGDTNIDVTETPDSTTDPGTGGDTENPGTAGDNGQNFEVSMSDNPVFGGHETDEQGHSENGSVTVIGSNGANKIALNENNEGGMTVTSGGHTVNINKGGDGLVNGLTNTTWDWSKYEEGGYKGSDNAATESQLHGAVSGIKTEITNMGDQITNMGSQITNIGNKVGELDSRIDEVGAGAAALAALHPLDFDPDDKWDFAAGYGNYRGENAVAIGAFYRPNEDTMFSVGGTVGNDDNMVNAGVSFKIGQGNGVSTSRVAMAKEIKDLRKELEAMKSAMLDVNAGRRLDTSKLQLFPDVPQNHWAYEYVATLAGNGVIEGYPDGNFDGARPMTRYEFAAMLYKAMLNGAKLSDKILTEFAPELERFTVDVVHKDKDGNPTVERVRVVKRDDAAK